MDQLNLIPKSIEDFFDDIDNPWTYDFTQISIPKTNSDRELVNWIITKSLWPYFPLELPGAPYSTMLEEALNLEDLFVLHRTQPTDHFDYANRGWKSICLHGESWDKTGHWESYDSNRGKRPEEIVYTWCDEICERCPETFRYFKDIFPNHNYQRLRYMWLDPNGYIQPHQDRQENYLTPINVALNNPKGCGFKMKDKGYVPFRSEGNACLVDIGNIHAVWNKSNEPRIHIISHGGSRDPFEKIVADSFRLLFT
jgi:hypothetical protein